MMTPCVWKSWGETWTPAAKLEPVAERGPSAAWHSACLLSLTCGPVLRPHPRAQIMFSVQLPLIFSLPKLRHWRESFSRLQDGLSRRCIVGALAWLPSPRVGCMFPTRTPLGSTRAHKLNTSNFQFHWKIRQQLASHGHPVIIQALQLSAYLVGWNLYF